ncbi:PREDICTED: uncharacterized mitochondrial protein AtMg00860 [Theobroma cacao]|uniref:Uncharacterized mitochondrial protein AtMg00860 n=1 Tax=Theobroma cacao TaxID=3641 RepID=A0AB32WMX8_THECC|nr:PREDICTED: uncharacterized mitochondrial protein AtMg00860 [Theobroma cacao]
MARKLGCDKAKVYALTQQDAQASNAVVIDILPICFIDSHVLNDPDVTHSFVSTYFASRLGYLKSQDAHEQHLKIVLQMLREHQLYAKFSKCEFWLDSVSFLGHIVSKNGMMVDPKKIEVVKKWPRPISMIEIHSFLELIGYYKRFVNDFSKIATSMTKLTQKGVKFTWTNA